MICATVCGDGSVAAELLVASCFISVYEIDGGHLQIDSIIIDDSLTKKGEWKTEILCSRVVLVSQISIQSVFQCMICCRAFWHNSVHL